MKQAKNVSIRLSDEDIQAIEVIKDAYGLSTLSSALRFAARRLSKNIKKKESDNGKK